MQYEVGQYTLVFTPIIECLYDNYKEFNCGNGSINNFLVGFDSGKGRLV